MIDRLRGPVRYCVALSLTASFVGVLCGCAEKERRGSLFITSEEVDEVALKLARSFVDADALNGRFYDPAKKRPRPPRVRILPINNTSCAATFDAGFFEDEFRWRLKQHVEKLAVMADKSASRAAGQDFIRWLDTQSVGLPGAEAYSDFVLKGRVRSLEEMDGRRLRITYRFYFHLVSAAPESREQTVWSKRYEFVKQGARSKADL